MKLNLYKSFDESRKISLWTIGAIGTMGTIGSMGTMGAIWTMGTLGSVGKWELRKMGENENANDFWNLQIDIRQTWW